MNGTCNRIKRLGAFVMSVILTMSVIQTVASEQQTNQVMAETTAQITVGCTNVNVRQSPTTSSPSITKLNGGHALVILDQPNGEWYHVSFTKDGNSYTGYVYAEYVTVLSAPPAAPGGSGSDADFEAYLTAQGFPESYKPYLRDLHTKHPQWKFVALQTGLDWNTVIENERNKSGQIKNLINGTSSTPRYNWRATEVGYSWANDTWSPYDGTTWVAASKISFHIIWIQEPIYTRHIYSPLSNYLMTAAYIMQPVLKRFWLTHLWQMQIRWGKIEPSRRKSWKRLQKIMSVRIIWLPA